MTKPSKKLPPGRPSISDEGATQVSVRLPNAMIDVIDAISAARLDQPGRANLIRELLAEALAARSRKGGGGGREKA